MLIVPFWIFCFIQMQFQTILVINEDSMMLAILFSTTEL